MPVDPSPSVAESHARRIARSLEAVVEAEPPPGGGLFDVLAGGDPDPPLLRALELADRLLRLGREIPGSDPATAPLLADLALRKAGAGSLAGFREWLAGGSFHMPPMALQVLAAPPRRPIPVRTLLACRHLVRPLERAELGRVFGAGGLAGFFPFARHLLEVDLGGAEIDLVARAGRLVLPALAGRALNPRRDFPPEAGELAEDHFGAGAILFAGNEAVRLRKHPDAKAGSRSLAVAAAWETCLEGLLEGARRAAGKGVSPADLARILAVPPGWTPWTPSVAPPPWTPSVASPPWPAPAEDEPEPSP
jgi:hypothetical protein